MKPFIVSLIGLLLIPACECAEWYTALVSNVDDETFYYHSNVWFNSTPFNTETSNVDNALFQSYSTVYVERVRITLDGTLSATCGSSCVLTFIVPPSHFGKYTLMHLVTNDGGVELIDTRKVNWKNTAPNYFRFEGSSSGYFDKYYCHTLGLNYGNYERSTEVYAQRSRARIGVMLNYYQPVGEWRAAEGIGLTYGWSRQWTDNVGSGRVESYSKYLFRKAKVEVYGSTTRGSIQRTVYSPIKIDGYSHFPVQYTTINSTLQNTLIPKNTFTMMVRLKRVSSYLWDQVYRVGTSTYMNTLFLTPDIQAKNYYYDGRHFRHYVSTTYSAWESYSPYYSALTLGHWHQLAFTTDLNRRAIWVDGFPLFTIPYYKGERLLSEFQENFELARVYASLAAEMSDFRFYYEELSTKELQQLQSEWTYTRKGCGDGERDMWEGCDDGNVIGGDGCSSECTIETGYICKGGNTTSVQPDKCVFGTYVVNIDFEKYGESLFFDQYSDATFNTLAEEDSNLDAIYSNPSRVWHFSVDQGWAGWDMTGTYLGTSLTNMQLGSTNLQTATCSQTAQKCCDSTFGKMIGGLRMCGGGCNLQSSFSVLPPHNYVRVTVQLAFIDNWDGRWVYLYADNQLRMRLYKHSSSFPVIRSEACLPTVGGGSYTCRVNYCGESNSDDLTTVDLFFFHNSSALNLKFSNTLNSATSKALGFTYLDMEVGVSDDFIFQSEGAGNLVVSEKYGSQNNSKGLLLSNNAFPSYAAKAGSSFSHVNFPQNRLLSSDSFVEFSYNFFKVPRAYGGFYLTILRLDHGQQDMFDYNLQACTDSTAVTGSCPDVIFYRICFDSSYEPDTYEWQSDSYCDERLFVAQSTWVRESTRIHDKFALKYGHVEGQKPGKFALQFGVYGDYYGSEREVVVYLDDIRVGEPSSGSSTCPALKAYASSTAVDFQVDGSSSAVAGTRTLGQWNIVLIDAATHAVQSTVMYYSDDGFGSFVESLQYGQMLLVAHSGPQPCGSDTSCKQALQSIGGTTLITFWNGMEGQTLAGVGMMGAGIGRMPLVVTALSDGGVSVANSESCHAFTVDLGENFHPLAPIHSGHSWNNFSTYYSDETSLGFVGCYTYGSESNLFSYGYDNGRTITPGSCSLVCHDSGFVFGRVYYTQCYCGDSYGNAYTISNRAYPVSSTGEVSNEYCSKIQTLSNPWNVACRGDFNQDCRYGTYNAWYRARSSESFDITAATVTCVNAVSTSSCLKAADNNYGSYHQSTNIATNTKYEIVLDLKANYSLDSIRIHTVTYYLISFEVLCAIDVNSYSSFGVVADGRVGNNNIYINAVDANGRTCRYVKVNLISSSGNYFRVREVRVNYFPSIANKQKYDLFTNTYNQTYYALSRSLNYRSNAYANDILPAGDMRSSFRVDTNTGAVWATNLVLDYELVKSYHVRFFARINKFTSGWFAMSDVDNFVEFPHNLRSQPWNVYVQVKCQSGPNKGGTGVAMIDGSEIGNVTFGSKSYPELYGGLLFAYNDKNIRLWAPSGVNGYIININTGWGQQNLQSAKSASVNVRASVGSNPQFDTGWVAMRSQSNDPLLVQKDFYHSLGSLEYAIVKVFYRAVDGPNSGYVFEAVGSAQADDDGGTYGGVVYGYSDTFVRVFLPNNTDVSKDNCIRGYNGWSKVTGQNECRDCSTLGGYPCNHTDGYAVYVPPGYGGGKYTQMTHNVEVRVRIWTYTYNKAAFVSEGIQLTSNGVSYAQLDHYAGGNIDSVYVSSRASAVKYPMYFKATSSSTGTDIRPRAYGGIVFAFSAKTIRLWAPAVSQNDMWHAYGQSIQIGDGWGNGTTPVGSQGATVKVMVYMANEPTGIDEVDSYMTNIQIADNNEIPYLQTTDASVFEDTYQAGHIVTSVYAYDVDGSKLSDFEILSGNSEDAFIVDSSGIVRVNNAAAIDFEKFQNFTLEIAVSDGSLAEVGVLFITVLDRNDVPILWPPFERSIREESAATTSVGDPLNATDTDISQSTLFYLLDKGNFDNAFGISACSGQIYVKNPDAIDFEDITGHSFFNLTVLVTDDGENAGNNTYVIPIQVLNANDRPTWATDMRTNISENSPVGELLKPNLNNWCTDPDYGDLLSYKILSISSSSLGSTADDMSINPDESSISRSPDFVVNNVTGDLTVGTPYLNFESSNEYTLYVRCTDYNLIEEQIPPNLYVDEYITIDILDANDAPAFLPSSLKQYLYENSPQGTVLLNSPLLATDEDRDDEVTYVIVQNYNSLLGIDSQSGQVFQVSSTGLNYEALQYFQIIVSATDKGQLLNNVTVDPKTTFATLNITVGDVNEQPYFVNSTIMMNETTSSAEIGTIVGTITGGDPDTFSNQVLTFTIIGAEPPGAASLFSVISSGSYSANLAVKATVSFEMYTSIELFFEVMDNGGNPADSSVAGLSSSGQVTIIVRDINDAPVTSCSTTSLTCTFSLPENSVTGVLVGNVAATDEDGNALTWSLVNPSVSFTKRFSINSANGDVTVLLDGDSIIDYEATDVYTFQAKVTDSTSTYPGPRSITSTYTIQIVDIDEPPYFLGTQNLEFGVSKDIDPGSVVGPALSNYFADQDAGTVLSYSVDTTMIVYPDTSGSFVDPSIFSISSTTGQLYIDTRPSSIPYGVDYLLKVNATVSDGIFNVTTEVTISVLDNNAPPMFDDMNCTVMENTVGPYQVCTLIATDPDDDAIAFALSSSNSDYFSISVDGVLSLRSGIVLNYESEYIFSLVVVAADKVKYPQTTSANVKVLVLDENDYPVVSSRSFSVPENQKFGSVECLTTMSFTDEDRDSLLCTTNSADFIAHEVNSANFNLSMSATLAAAASSSKLVTVTSTLTMEYIYVTLYFDSQSTSSTASSMQVEIVDVSFRMVTLNVWPIEWASSKAGLYYAVFPVLSSDLNGVGTWTVTLTNTGSLQAKYDVFYEFTFDGRDPSDTSTTTSCYLGLTTALDYETRPVIKFSNKVSDNEAFRYANITVNIIDVNEPPVVDDYTLNLDENSGPGAIAQFSDLSPGYVTVADQEDNAMVFSIVSGNDDGFFQVRTIQTKTPATFAIEVTDGANIDFESKSQYILLVKATESETLEAYSDTASITIVVNNINDVTVTAVVNMKNDSFGRPNAPLDSGGGDTVNITGTNFGLKLVTEAVEVTYGPSGVEYVAQSCSVVPGDNVQITCLTAAGVGMEHVWRVEILSSHHRYTTTYASRVTTSYYRPLLESVTNLLNPGESYRTVGNEKVRIVGSQLGTAVSAFLNSTCRHFAGFTKLTTFGSQFYLEDTMEEGFHKCRSALALYLSDVNDEISLVSDTCPSAGEIILTVRKKFATNRSSFSPSNVAGNLCYFERTTDEDWHGINEEGRLTDHQSIYDEVYLPAAMCVVSTSKSSSALAKACSADTVWRTYVSGKPKMYYSNIQVSSAAAGDDVSGNASTSVATVTGGQVLLSLSCGFNQTDTVDCYTQAGVGGNYRVRYVIAGQISDEVLDSSFAVSYHAPVMLSLNGSTPSLLLDTRGYTTVTPDTIYIRTLFGGPSSAFTAYGHGLVSYGQLNASGAYSSGYYVASCVIAKSTYSQDSNGYWYCRDSGVCAYEQVDLLTCRPVPGTGAQHSWRVEVGNQQSGFATSKTSYKAPIIAYMNPDQWPFSDTAGGDSIILVGDQFGPEGVLDLYGSIDARYGSLTQLRNGNLFHTESGSCSVTSPHEVITCTVGVGTGKNHSWIVSVAGQISNLYYAASSYSPPILVDFAVYNSSNYYSVEGVPEDVQSYATEGGQFVEIIGRNFGPVLSDDWYNAPITAIAAYMGDADDTYLWQYTNCTVTKAHLKMVCTTSPGVGSELKWSIKVDNQTNTVPTTSYAPPQLTTVLGVGFNVSQGLNTRGGQYIDLIGNNFGPDISFVERISFGPTGGEYVLHDPKSRIDNCQFTTPHKVFRCLTPEGFGQQHYFTVRVAGQKTESSEIGESSRVSYKRPTITSVIPSSGTTRGGYSLTVTGTNFGPTSGAVFSFWGKTYSSYPLTYFSHEEVEFVVPEGAGSNIQMQMGHRSSWCDDACAQYSTAVNFSYVRPQLDRLIFSDSSVPGYSNLTLYGKTVSSKDTSQKYLDGGSFGASSMTSYTDDAGVVSEFLNNVFVFPFNVSGSYIDDELTRFYDELSSSSSSLDELEAKYSIKICLLSSDVGNIWTHDMINCLVLGTNGTVVISSFGISDGTYLRSDLFLFKEKSPVINSPLGISSPFPSDKAYPTTGGFSISVTGLYFGSYTQVGVQPEGLDILFYLKDYMDYVKCRNVIVVTVTDDDQQTTVSCTVPPGQGKNVAVLVRKGGDDSRLISDYIEGDSCQACIDFDPPVIVGFGAGSSSRRLLSEELDFPVYSMTTGIDKLILYGYNFGLPGGSVVTVAGTILAESDSHYHSNVTVTLPEGVGTRLPISVTVANHDPVTQSSDGTADFVVNYYPPDVHKTSKTMLHTAGNEVIFVEGTNFGMAATSFSAISIYSSEPEYLGGHKHHFLRQSSGLEGLQSANNEFRALQLATDNDIVDLVSVNASSEYTGFVTIDGSMQAVVSWNHTAIVLVTYEAPGGKGKSLQVTAGGQSDLIDGLAYYPPQIVSISLDHAPTSGLTASNQQIRITLVGTDFGSAAASRYVTFGATVISGADLNSTHYTIDLFVPPGQGVGVAITVTVEGQTSNAVYFDYDPPLAVALSPNIGNTDACNQWESLQAYMSRLDTNPSAQRLCTDKQYVTLSGYSFGTTSLKIVVGGDLVCQTDSTGEIVSAWNCFDCAIDQVTGKSVCYQDHREVVFWAPQSYGQNLTVELFVDDRRDNASTPVVYSFYPPQITVSSPGSNSQGYGYIDARGDSITIQGVNLGGEASWVSINFTGMNRKGTITQLSCANAMWNPGSFNVGDGFPYLTCDMPEDIVGAKNMSIHVAGQTVSVPVRRIVDNSLFISTCKASYDSSNQQTLYYGLRYYRERCVECPVGALCKPEEYEVDPVSDEAFWLSYYDVESVDAKDQCDTLRRPPYSSRTTCPVFEGCFPPEACLGSNTCEDAYSYVVEDCIAERSKDKYANNTCFQNSDCNKGNDICAWDRPEQCSVCKIVPGSVEPGYCQCTAAPKCSLCKVREYYRIGGKCVKCPQNVLVLIVLFVTALLAFVVGAYYLNKYKFNLAFVAIGFDYFQVLAVFAASDIVWPPLIIKMFTISLFFSFDINITAPECAFPDISYESKWYATMLLPIMGGMVLFMMFVAKAIHKFIWRNKRGWTALTKHGNQLMAMFVIMLYYLYLPLLRKALEIVNCNPADPEDGHLYTEWTSINCPSGVCRCWEKFSDPQMQLLPYALASLVLYAIGYPIYVTYIIIHNKELIKEDQLLRAMNTGDTRASNPMAYDVRKKFHKLYYHFKPGKVYWLIYVLIRKFWIAVAALLFRSNPTFQMSFILLVMFVCYILQVKHRPFMSTVERNGELERHRAKVEEAIQAQEKGERLDETMMKHLKIQRIIDNVEKKDEIQKKRIQGNRGAVVDGKSAAITQESMKEFFWDFNNVELYLLGCAIFVCISGIMFESDQYSNNNALHYQLMFLTFLVILVIASSILYFVVVFVSEILTTFGYDTKGAFDMFMSKEYKKNQTKEKDMVAEMELRHMDSNDNPMNQGVDEESKTKQTMEMAQLADENELLMKQLADLKKKEQLQRMSSFGSNGPAIQTKKKLKKKSGFESQSSGGSFHFDDERADQL